MKKFVFFALTLITTSVFANEIFDYEITKTSESPGFFMIKLFSSENIKPFQMKEIYVKNFSKKDSSKYTKLFPVIQQKRQGKIINYDDFDINKINKSREIIIFLGDTIENFNNFSYKEGDIFNQFEKFTKDHLEPVLINNIKIESKNGNIYEIRTKYPHIKTNYPAIFVGKFKDSKDTEINIIGKNRNDELSSEIKIDLSNEFYSEDNTQKYLPELWEQLALYSDNPAKKSLNYDSILSGNKKYLFGIFLIILALIIIKSKSNEQEIEEFDYYKEEFPVFHSKIPESEYESYSKNLDQEKSTNSLDHPFEVVWKS